VASASRQNFTSTRACARIPIAIAEAGSRFSGSRLRRRRLCLQEDQYSLAPFTLALVLGNRAEDAFRLSMIGCGGDMKVFWSNRLVGSITTLASLRAAVLAGDR
jgi:hypothetical protein